jgi:hypothetical protein
LGAVRIVAAACLRSTAIARSGCPALPNCTKLTSSFFIRELGIRQLITISGTTKKFSSRKALRGQPFTL